MDVILGVLLLVGCAVVSVAFVCISYDAGNWEGYPEVMPKVFRVVGFIGTCFFPAVLWSSLKELYWEDCDEEEGE